MNKNYRSIWSDARGGWVVVSERTAARGKRGRSVRIVVAAGLLAAATVAQGAANVNLNTATLASVTDTSSTNGSNGLGTTIYNVGGSLPVGLYVWTDSSACTSLGTLNGAAGCWLNTSQSAISAGLNFSGNAGTTVHKDLGNTLPIIGAATAAGAPATPAGTTITLNSNTPTAGNYSSQNIQTYADAANGQIQIQMATNPVFAGVIVPSPTVANPNNVVQLSSTGLSNGGNTITNVAPGVNGTDAVNLNQLNSSVSASNVHYYSVNDGGTHGGNYTNNGAAGTNSLAAGVGASTAAAATGSVAIGNGASATLANNVALGAGSVDKAAAQAAVDTANGITGTYAGTATGVVSVGAAGAERQIVNVAPGAVTSSSTDAVNGSQLFATDQAISSVSKVANEGWNLSTNGGTATNVAPGGKVDFSPGSSGNIKISQSGTDVTIDTNPNLTATSVTTGNTTMNTSGITIIGGASGTVSLTQSGLNNGGNTITDVAPGTATTDAVNVGQLNAVATVANEGWNLSTNGGASTNVPPGGKVDFSPGSSGNIKISQSGTDVTVDTNPNLTATSVTTGNTMMNTTGVTVSGGAAGTVSLTQSGLNNGGNTITNVAAGTATTDAVNLGQLNAVSTVANEGWNLSTNGGAATNVAPGGKVDFSPGSSGNIKISQSGTNVTIDTNPNLNATTLTTMDGAGNISVTSGMGITTTDAAGDKTAVGATGITITPAAGNTVSLTSAGLNNGGNKITNVAAGTATTDAVNVGQLNAVSTVANEGWNLSTNGGAATNVAPGAKVDFSPGSSGNIQISQSGTDVTIDTSPNLTATSVTTGNTTINTTGVTITGGPSGTVSLTQNGLNNGGNIITNVAPGAITATSTDAVNGEELYQAEQNLNTTIQKSATHYYSVNDGGTQGANYANDGATGTDSLAAGVGASASSTGGVAIGSDASVSALGGIALGADSIADRVAGTYVDPISGKSFTTTQGAVSVGAVGSTRQITNVAAGTQTTDAVNLGQLESAMSQLSSVVVNQGSGQPTQTFITGNPVTYTAPVASGTGATAAGSGANASGANSTAVGDSATASGANSVALGANSVATANNTVSVGSPGNERTISNVAPGVNGTDAVNLNQLNSGLGSLRQDMYGGVAAAMAVAGLPQPSSPGKSMVAVATSNWQGQQGVAIGVSTVSENGSWIFKGAVTTSSHGGAGGVVGAGYQW